MLVPRPTRSAISLERICANASNAGATMMAVSMKTAWVEMRCPQAPIVAAATPPPMDAKRALRPIRSPKAA